MRLTVSGVQVAAVHAVELREHEVELVPVDALRMPGGQGLSTCDLLSHEGAVAEQPICGPIGEGKVQQLAVEGFLLDFRGSREPFKEFGSLRGWVM